MKLLNLIALCTILSGCQTGRMDNQPDNDIRIEVIQGGINPESALDDFAPINLESTEQTGILHVDGVISMARGSADSATHEIFICIGDQPSLDFGGLRNTDGQGFAAFGRVLSGMDVVVEIQSGEAAAQRLIDPVLIGQVVRR
jgi:peptidyl-prolyl cis-trans isomerase A (cyclophilin A)